MCGDYRLACTLGYVETFVGELARAMRNIYDNAFFHRCFHNAPAEGGQPLLCIKGAADTALAFPHEREKTHARIVKFICTPYLCVQYIPALDGEKKRSFALGKSRFALRKACTECGLFVFFYFKLQIFENGGKLAPALSV